LSAIDCVRSPCAMIGAGAHLESASTAVASLGCPAAPADGAEGAATVTTVFPSRGWWRSPAARLVAFRVLLRLASLGAIVAVLRSFPQQFKDAGATYIRWIESLGPAGGGATFLAVAVAFCAVSPTGYLPSIVAGLTFQIEGAIPISYLAVLLGAELNVVLVRGLLGRSAWLHAKCSKRRAGGMMAGLEALVEAHPVRMVALLRLPFIGNGVLNYLFSLSNARAWPMFVGNAIGLLPGAILFAVAGAQVRSVALLIVDGGGSPATIGILVAVSLTVLVSVAVVTAVYRREAARAAVAARAVEGAGALSATADRADGTESPTGVPEGRGGASNCPHGRQRSKCKVKACGGAS